jgi:single-strand DNA-binding protein
VAVDGRLRWSSWEDKNGGGKRSKVDIVADTVQFLGSREDGGGQGGGAQGGGGQAQDQGNQGFGASDVPADTSDFGDPVPAGGGGAGNDDDIPF